MFISDLYDSRIRFVNLTNGNIYGAVGAPFLSCITNTTNATKFCALNPRGLAIGSDPKFLYFSLTFSGVYKLNIHTFEFSALPVTTIFVGSLAFDSNFRLYYMNYSFQEIWVFDEAKNQVSKYAGKYQTYPNYNASSNNVPATQFSFKSPSFFAFDPDDNLLVSDVSSIYVVLNQTKRLFRFAGTGQAGFSGFLKKKREKKI